MTTVVVDNEVGLMAADTMAVSNDGEYIVDCGSKITRVETRDGDYLVGIAGNEGPAEIFLDWMLNGDWDDPLDPLNCDEGDDFSAVILGDDKLLIVDKWMRPYSIESRWYGIGTGGPLAVAVLKAGCGIVKAMEVAIDMCPYSGLDYEVVYVK